MRPSVCLALLLAAAAPGAGAGERTRAALRAVLPPFDPAAAAPRAPDAPLPAAEGEVVVLPEFRVLEKKVAAPEPDAWLSAEAVTRREMRRAEADMNALDLALNRWHLPYLSASFAQRARTAYEQRRRGEELHRLERLQRMPGP
jgi:hypothetical protein